MRQSKEGKSSCPAVLKSWEDETADAYVTVLDALLIASRENI